MNDRDYQSGCMAQGWLTMRAPDVWDSARFQAFFVA